MISFNLKNNISNKIIHAFVKRKKETHEYEKKKFLIREIHFYNVF